MKAPTQDIYGFGMVVFQIAAGGVIPYSHMDEGDAMAIKAADTDLSILLAQLPSSTPLLIRTVIIETTKLMPPDRASLGTIDEILRDLLRTLGAQTSSP